MPSKARKALNAFLDDIPAEKLTGLPMNAGTIHKDDDFRLDMQGMTTEKKDKEGNITEPAKHNIQIQVNNETSISTLKKSKGSTVAGPSLVPRDDPWDAETLRADLKDKIVL
ncbi:hypothetical protein MKEN_01384700 [Mycena kentingensis (nom. inval.)]|nr:hypothetical protein MKEN_01384700 [Mycena kentingensis (nom. inval.)]